MISRLVACSELDSETRHCCCFGTEKNVSRVPVSTVVRTGFISGGSFLLETTLIVVLFFKNITKMFVLLEVDAEG